MIIKPIRWTENPFLCFHCGRDVAIFEAELDYQGAVVNQCLCALCINLDDNVILARALKPEKPLISEMIRELPLERQQEYY